VLTSETLRVAWLNRSIGRQPRTLVLEDGPVMVQVRESPRARSARIVVRRDGLVEIVVPRRVSYAEIDRLLERHRTWISKRTTIPMQLGLDRPGVVWRGLEPIPIELVPSVGRASARLRDARLVVGDVPEADAREAIERWYRREARRLITETVEREAARLQLTFRAIAIRDQQTRWGSCSRRGTLSFNWRLAIAPRAVREYVVVHELCHLRELNHSKAFWRLVATAMPGWEERKRWLAEHGRELQAYTVALPPGLCSRS
jgi:predicted metal-dependent hydrolase